MIRYDSFQIILISNVPSKRQKKLNPAGKRCQIDNVQDQQGNIWMGNSKGLIYMNFKQNNQMKRYTYPVSYTHLDVYKRQVFANGV